MLKRVEVTFWGYAVLSQTRMLRLLVALFPQDFDIRDQGIGYCDFTIFLFSGDSPAAIFAQAFEALAQLREHASEAGMSIKFTTEEE
jgi:hypothetical protein